MAVEIGTLVLKGRFGPARSETPTQPVDVERKIEILRQDLLREMEDRLEEAARRARER